MTSASRHHQPALFEQVALGSLDHLDLVDAAEVAADDDVVLQAEALPMRDHGGDILAQVAEGVALKAARVGGEDGGGQDVAGHARGRNDGQGDGQRAFADAGNIVDGENAHNKRSFLIDCFIIERGGAAVKRSLRAAREIFCRRRGHGGAPRGLLAARRGGLLSAAARVAAVRVAAVRNGRRAAILWREFFAPTLQPPAFMVQ